MGIKRLKKQITELEKANEILRSASVFFGTALQPLVEMIAFIDVIKASFAVALVCRTMRAGDVGFVMPTGILRRRVAQRQPERCRISCLGQRLRGCMRADGPINSPRNPRAASSGGSNRGSPCLRE